MHSNLTACFFNIRRLRILGFIMVDMDTMGHHLSRHIAVALHLLLKRDNDGGKDGDGDTDGNRLRDVPEHVLLPSTSSSPPSTETGSALKERRRRGRGKMLLQR